MIQNFLLLCSLLFCLPVMAQSGGATNCIQLEGLSLRCLPNEAHGCYTLITKNVEEIGPPTANGVCKYFDTLRAHLINPNNGPASVRCRSWNPSSACANPEYTGQCSMDQCDVAFAPTCDQQCETCVNNVIQENVTFTPRGCAVESNGTGPHGDYSGDVCTGNCRQRCSDEPWAGGIEWCPNHGSCQCRADGPTTATHVSRPECPSTKTVGGITYNVYFGQLKTCTAQNLCPTAVIFTSGGWQATTQPPTVPPGQDCPRGSVCGVTINGPTDPSQCPIVQPTMPPPPISCPWLGMFGKVRRACEPVPAACKWPIPTGMTVAQAQAACQAWIDANIPQSNMTPMSVPKGNRR